MKSIKPHVYMTTNRVNGKIYIGQHKGNNKYYKGGGKVLKQAFKKHGWDNFECLILEQCDDQKSLDEAEIYWIKFYNSTDRRVGYNIAEGGNKIVVPKEYHPNWGKSLKESTKEKISQSLMGHKLSQETRDKISKTAKERGSHAGPNNGAWKDKSHVTDESLREFFKGCKSWKNECMDYFGLSHKALRRHFKRVYGTTLVKEVKSKLW